MTIKNGKLLLPNNHFLRLNGQSVDLYTNENHDPENPRDLTCLNMTVAQFLEAAAFIADEAYRAGHLREAEITKLIDRFDDIRENATEESAAKVKKGKSKTVNVAEAAAGESTKSNTAASQGGGLAKATKSGKAVAKPGESSGRSNSSSRQNNSSSSSSSKKKSAVASATSISRTQTAKQVKNKPKGKGK